MSVRRTWVCGNRVIVQIKANVRSLANLDRQLQFARVGILGQTQQTWLFAFEGFAHGDRGLLAARAIRGRTSAPECRLGIQIVEVDELARGKEVLAYISDCTFDTALLVASRNGHRTGLIAMMGGEREQS